MSGKGIWYFLPYSGEFQAAKKIRRRNPSGAAGSEALLRSGRSVKKGPLRLGESLFFRWCGGGDLNSHSFAATRSLALRVYQFRHPRITVGYYNIAAPESQEAEREEKIKILFFP